MDVKVSVIIPIYNIEKYLPECLESIINQTFKEIEIICVNDGSTDNSLEILKTYAQKDPRIKIINQENKGPSFARNNGLNNANGDYILFVDSDDWLHKSLVFKTYNNAITNNADIICFDCLNVYNSSIVQNRRIPAFIRKNNKILFYFEEHKDIAYINCTSWSKLYKKEFLIKNKLKFPEEYKLAEDLIFWFELLIKNPKISLLNECLYYYRKRQNSLTQKTNDLINKQWEITKYDINSSKENQLLFYDYNCRSAIYNYSTIKTIQLIKPYEKSLKTLIMVIKNILKILIYGTIQVIDY